MIARDFEVPEACINTGLLDICNMMMWQIVTLWQHADLKE